MVNVGVSGGVCITSAASDTLCCGVSVAKFGGVISGILLLSKTPDNWGKFPLLSFAGVAMDSILERLGQSRPLDVGVEP